MKKIFLTIVAVFCLGFITKAQSDGFFNDNSNVFREDDTTLPQTPNSHGLNSNVNAPIGNGLLILSLLGAGYVIKKKKENKGDAVK